MLLNILITIAVALVITLVVAVAGATILAILGVGSTPWTLTPKEKDKLWRDYDGR